MAHNGKKVPICESHDVEGVLSHMGTAGLSLRVWSITVLRLFPREEQQPLKNVFQIIEEEPEWITYDRWGTVIPEGKFAAKIGAAGFDEALEKYGGREGQRGLEQDYEAHDG